MPRVKVVAYGTIADDDADTERLVRNYLADKIGCDAVDVRWFENQASLEAKALRVEVKAKDARIKELEDIINPPEDPDGS